MPSALAIFSRLIVIDFSKTYTENANPDLINELTTTEELSGLFTVLLKRLPRILKFGISYTKSIEEISHKYKFRINSVKNFADAHLQESLETILEKISYTNNTKIFVTGRKFLPNPNMHLANN